MKKLIILIGIIVICFNSFGQIIVQRSSAATTPLDPNLFTSLSFRLPVFNDSTSANLAVTLDSCGKQFYNRATASVWFRACIGASSRKWIEMLPSGSPSGTTGWLVGGNIVGTVDPDSAQLGSTNSRTVYFITNDTKRFALHRDGIQANTGDVLNLGVNTVTGMLAYGSSSSTPTWQQTLTAGSTLTGANTVDGGAFNFTFGNLNKYTFNILEGGGKQFDINYGLTNTNRFRVNGNDTRLLSPDGASGSVIVSNGQATITAPIAYIAGTDSTRIFAGNPPGDYSALIMYPRYQDQYAIDSLIWRTVDRTGSVKIEQNNVEVYAGTSEIEVTSTDINVEPASFILNFGGGTTASAFRFLEPSASGTNYTSWKAVAQSANINYSLPPSVLAGGVLTDVAGNGVLTWVAPSPMVYPGAGIANSTGSAWGTSYTTTGSGTVVPLQTSPSFVTSVIGGASMDIFNTVTTTANFLKAATTVNMMASAGVLNFGGGATVADFRFLEGSGGGTNYVGFKSPATLAGNTVYTLPTAFPAGTYLLNSTSAGVMGFTDPSTLTGLPYIAITGTSILTGNILVDGSGGPYTVDIKSNAGAVLRVDGNASIIGDPDGAQTGAIMKIESGSGTAHILSTAIAAGSNGDAITLVDNTTGELGVAPNLAFRLMKDSTDMYTVNGRIWVKDRDGNKTQISPHNEKNEWIYKSTDKDGVTTEINMIRLAELLERTTGEKLIYKTKN